MTAPVEVERFLGKLDKELKTGVIGVVLLLAIDRTGPDYGYRILRNLQEWSGGRLAFKEGTAYPILQNLERTGLLTSFWGDGAGGPPRKYYQTTALGREALVAALSEWDELTGSVDVLRRKMPKGGKG